MTFIIKQAYIKVVREVSSIEQKNVEEERFLYLFEDKITTKYREFPIEDVMDLSFKPLEGDGGILFLHMNHGVYSYHVPTSPKEFIKKCQSYLKGATHEK